MGAIKSINDINILDTCDIAKQSIEEYMTKIFSSEFKPPPKMNLVEWADTFRKLPDNSAEPGQWKTDRVPPSREPMLAISDPDVQEITVMSCIQLLKTELMINTALYFIHQEPSPIMYVAPKKEIAEAWSKERFTKSANAVEEIKDLMSHNRRDQGNTILQKQFPGGQLSIVSARNPDDLAMRACRIMLFDECDKYPANVGSGDGGSGGEGDPIAVGWGRATTFGRRAKKIVACSPTTQGRSRIEKEYLSGSQHTYHQPCPKCNHTKELTWDDVVIPVDEETGEYLPDDAYIACSECGHKWSEGDRIQSIDNGFYKAKRPHVKRHLSFKVTSLASPFTPVVTLANEFVDAIGDNNLLKAFYNTRMARTWKEQGEQPEWEDVYNRRENYKIGVVPEGGLMLTMGMDVQKAGVYYEVVAYGRRRISWSVDKGYLAGDIEEESFRDQVKELWSTTYKNHKGIDMNCEIINVDSGYKTNAVYSLVREYGDPRVRAVKGDKEGRLTSSVGTPTPVDVDYMGKRISRGLMLWHVGSGVLKDQFYSWLSLKAPTEEKLKAGGRFPSGYCHFPEYDEEFFKQITAEQKVITTNKKGFEVFAWEKTRKDNHFLDCRNYARAGATMLQIDRMRDEDWDLRESMYEGSVTVDSDNSTNDTRQNTKAAPVRKRRRSSWLNN
ncbi:large terminase subunit [Alteromonas phage JH01]|nr:large terminase subunit [Alteromonas phage JH01]